jgi:hypothetical protein
MKLKDKTPSDIMIMYVSLIAFAVLKTAKNDALYSPGHPNSFRLKKGYQVER